MTTKPQSSKIVRKDSEDYRRQSAKRFSKLMKGIPPIGYQNKDGIFIVKSKVKI